MHSFDVAIADVDWIVKLDFYSYPLLIVAHEVPLEVFKFAIVLVIWNKHELD